MTGTSTPAPAPTGDEPDVLVSRHGRLGHIQLNRPRAMNALTLPMVEAIASALATWAEDDSVEAALISGAGDRGLCAGGDVVTVRREALEDGPEVASRFWAAEYAMNLAIAEYPKPIVALMDGIVLGGGVGVSSHAGIRIVTDRSRVGMPETGIGLFPDVGGTYLLSRAPGETGTHLALTGTMIGGSDAIAVGLADHLVPHADLDALVAALAGDDWAGAVATYAVATAEAPLIAARAWIDDAYAADTVEQVLQRLRGRPEPEALAAADVITTRSPTSLKVTFRALREARELPGLREALAAEFRIASRLTSGHDFVEGVRAQLVDKDRTPHWDPPTLAGVTPEMVDAYFVG